MHEDDLINALQQMPDCRSLLWASKQAGRRIAVFGDMVGNLLRNWKEFEPSSTRLLSFVDPFSAAVVLFDQPGDWEIIADSLESCVPLAAFLPWRGRTLAELRRAADEGFLTPIPANRLAIWFDGEESQISVEGVGCEVADCLDESRTAIFVREGPRLNGAAARTELALLCTRYASSGRDRGRASAYAFAAEQLVRETGRDADETRLSRRWKWQLRRAVFNYLMTAADFDRARNDLARIDAATHLVSKVVWDRPFEPTHDQSALMNLESVAVTSTPTCPPALVRRVGNTYPDEGETPWIRFRRVRDWSRTFSQGAFGIGGSVAAYRSTRRSNGAFRDTSLGIVARVRRDAVRDPALPNEFEMIPIEGYVIDSSSLVMRLAPGIVERAAALGTSFECAAVRTEVEVR